jgi:hypothetical protein
MPQGGSIRRAEARGDVTVVSKDQNASGELGVYDTKTKTITLTGNVVVSQGKNVVRGERVVPCSVTRRLAAMLTSRSPRRGVPASPPSSGSRMAGSKAYHFRRVFRTTANLTPARLSC